MNHYFTLGAFATQVRCSKQLRQLEMIWVLKGNAQGGVRGTKPLNLLTQYHVSGVNDSSAQLCRK
jgi:hypothetical protein